MTLTDADLAYQRATQEQHLPSTGQRLQRVTAADGMGGQGETWPPQGPTFACRVTEASTDIPQDLTMRLKGNDGYTLTVPKAQVITFRDRIQVTGFGAGVYEVVAVGGGGSWPTANRLLCVKVG